MVMILNVLILFTTLQIVETGPVYRGISSDAKSNINTGIAEFHRALDGLEKLVSSEKIIKHIQQLSGFLGVAGGMISFVLMFNPEGEAAELTLMKQQFTEVNAKLDRISEDLENVKDMITLESQRAEYINAASKILYGYNQLTKQYFDEISAVSCSSGRQCLRERLSISNSYLPAFNVKADLYKIITGTVQSTSVFGDPLLQLIKTTYKCDIQKLLIFANGVIKLAFKAQQVILAYQKLTGTVTSVSLSVKEWSKMVYDVRKKTDEIKIDCYHNIRTYIREDVENTIYQTNMNSNKQAADEMKKALDLKYPWIFWTVISYEAYGSSDHAGKSSFRNMPKAKEARKRVLRVVAQDKGTYTSQREQLASVIENIARDTIFPVETVHSAYKIYNAFEDELSKTSVWRTISTFLVLSKNVKDFQVAIDSDHDLYYYNETLFVRHNTTRLIFTGLYYRFWVSFRSSEKYLPPLQVMHLFKTCHNGGSSIRLPLTTQEICSCQPFYGGENCTEYDKITVAANVDGLLGITGGIPKLTDVYYGLLDVHDYIASSLNHIDDSVAKVGVRLQRNFDQLKSKLTTEFQWANLITQYGDSISHLEFYLHKFHTINSSKASYLTESKLLARTILQPGYVDRWAFEFDYLVRGRNEFLLLEHKPLLLLIMDKHKNIACSAKYRDVLDDSWRQIVILQNQLYLMWTRAKSIIGESADQVLQKYNETLIDQAAFMDKITCKLTVPQSANLGCSGGYYAYPGLQPVNQCGTDHYLAGDTKQPCNNGSSCHPCNCNTQGSSDSKCNYYTGACNCTNNYYGRTCNDRDCQWARWGSYGPCSKSCGNGVKSRTRTKELLQKGAGKQCTGEPIEIINCIDRCCLNRTAKDRYFCNLLKDYVDRMNKAGKMITRPV